MFPALTYPDDLMAFAESEEQLQIILLNVSVARRQMNLLIKIKDFLSKRFIYQTNYITDNLYERKTIYSYATRG